MALFIFDFDETVVNGHTHNYLMKHATAEDKNNNEALWNLIKHMPPIGAAEDWKNLFAKLHETGHHIAFASYGKYGNVIIPRYLREIIGVPQERIDAMPIQSWLPDDPDKRKDKNQHILQIAKELQYRDYAQTIVLIDNDIDLLIAARNSLYTTIHATPDALHLKYVASLANMLNLQPSGNMHLFQDAIKKNPMGHAFGDELIKVINSGRMTERLADPAEEHSGIANVFMVASNDIIQTAQQYKLKNCILINRDNAFYQVDEKGNVEQYPVSREAFANCLAQHQLNIYLNTATEMPCQIGRGLSDKAIREAMDAINQLILQALSNALPEEKQEEKNSSPSSMSCKR